MQTLNFNHPVLDYFVEISQIPRGSGNEQAISDYLMNFAREHGLNALQDSAKNVVIRKKASAGYENAPTVMLQGHMDMVCTKNSDVEHDFLTEPIELVVDGDYLHANGTTLGADDGIGVAFMLAVLADTTLQHPDIECLITTGEEIGMLGVKALDYDLFQLKSKIMINLDAGEEGVFIAGCSGGGRVDLKLPIKRTTDTSLSAWKISVDGLKGGHSGLDIHLGRANAIQVLGRILQDLGENIQLYSICGGTKENCIPLHAEALIGCADKDFLVNKCGKWQDILRDEYHDSDPDIVINTEPAGTKDTFCSAETFKQLCSLIALIPQGVISMNRELNKVATSANLGVITSNSQEIVLTSCVRSSIPSHMETLLLPKYESLAQLGNVSMEKHDFYGGWAYHPKSRVGELALQSYRKFSSIEPICTITHGGLECGLIHEALGELDTIAFLPELSNYHSPGENLSISSTKTYYKVLTDLLSRLNA